MYIYFHVLSIPSLAHIFSLIDQSNDHWFINTGIEFLILVTSSTSTYFLPMEFNRVKKNKHASASFPICLRKFYLSLLFHSWYVLQSWVTRRRKKCAQMFLVSISRCSSMNTAQNSAAFSSANAKTCCNKMYFTAFCLPHSQEKYMIIRKQKH